MMQPPLGEGGAPVRVDFSLTRFEVILYAAGIAAGFVYTAWQFGG